MLRELLVSLINQETNNKFTYSIIVVDNDSEKTARNVVFSVKDKRNIKINYYVEPVQNIALARNKCILMSNGNFIAFIDDDEVPLSNWIYELHKAYLEYNPDGVLGPIIPKFMDDTPQWVIDGKFYERLSYETGTILKWENTRTGNVLFNRNIFLAEKDIFRKEYGSGGEDRDFFRRSIKQGKIYIWCAEAPVFETIQKERFKRIFMIKRALLRGQNPGFTKYDVLKSIVAIPMYTILLPFLILIGHHVFMKYLIKDFDHIGRILASLKYNPIKEKYVIE